MEKEINRPRVAIARKYAKNIIKESNIEQPPIMLKEVVLYLKNKYDLSVYPWKFSDNVDGIQVTKGETSGIGYNQSKHPHRQRFTVAHEIGHFLLGHTQEHSDHYFDLLNDDNKPMEVEANQFAAELLIPLSMIKTDLNSKIYDIKKLSQIYWVSENAMWNKIINCKLLDKI